MKKKALIMCGFFLLAVNFAGSTTYGQARQIKAKRGSASQLETMLRQIANSPRGPEWEFQHYDRSMRFSPQQLIEHLRKIEAELLRKGIENDVAVDKPVPIDEDLRPPLQGELLDTLGVMSQNPSPKLILELKRLIESSKLPDHIREKAVRVYGVLGGDSQYLRKLIDSENDGIRAGALAAYV